MQKHFESIMREFSGYQLVFFTDCKMQDGKKGEWLRRRNDDYRKYKNLYWRIGECASRELLSGIIPKDMALRSISYELERLAQKFGQFHYSYKRESDTEIARYATKNKALAVISNDGDFLIFPGPWKLWSTKFQFNGPGSLKTNEYDRNILPNALSLCHDQLPLFATLKCNDFTKRFDEQLSNKFGYGFEPVANYVRNLNSAYFSDSDLERITQDVLGYTNDNTQNIFRKSLDFYDIDSPLHIWIDANILYPDADKLYDSAIYPIYLMNMSKLQCISMGYYDLPQGNNLPEILIEWTRRRVGVLRQHARDASFSLSILAMKDSSVGFQEYQKTPADPPSRCCSVHLLIYYFLFRFRIVSRSPWPNEPIK